MNARKYRNQDEEQARACETREDWSGAATSYLSAANAYATRLTRESDKRGPDATWLRVRVNACHSRRAKCLAEAEWVRTAYARRVILAGEA